MLFEAFKKLREERPRSAAFMLSSGDRAYPISWRQFTDDIAAVVNIIRENMPGAVVGVLGENSYEWMVVHAALIFSGSTVMPVDPNLSGGEIAERLKFVRANALVYSSAYRDKVRDVRKLCLGLATGGFGTRKTERYVEASRAKIAEDPSLDIWQSESVDIPDDYTSMLVFTSGTTSKPRGAELTLRGLETYCAGTHACLPMKPGNRSLMLLPLHHIYGICVSYAMLSRGVALGICPDFRRIYDSVDRFRANFMFLVPALAGILAEKIQQHGKDAEKAFGQHIDFISVGGAALPRRIYEHLLSLGIKTITCYGLTETTASYSSTPYLGNPHVGSQGKVWQTPGVETKVSETGELLIKGPCVMKGYFREPERTAKAIDRDGWFHTGDLGRIDEDGFVWITGRASRTIILSSGKKVAPEELEERLVALPGMCEALVTGDAETRDIKAEVYGTISEKRICEEIGELNLTLPVYMRIRTIVVRKEPFPRTSSGKIMVG